MAKQIVFLVFSHAHLLDLAGPAQVFYEASKHGGQAYHLLYAALSSKKMTSQALQLGSLLPVEKVQLEVGDLLCLPGIDFQSFKLGLIDDEIKQLTPWVKNQLRRGAFISSICSGALLLGRMKLLDHRECTTHWKCLEYLANMSPKAKVVNRRLYCMDKQICTSAGMTAGIDMALALVEEWDSPLVAARVAKEMVINVRRPDTVSQEDIFLDFKNHFNPEVYQAQQILSNQLSTRYTAVDLAQELHVSPRHLARLFKDHTGETIHTYREKVRIKLAEKLLKHTEKSIKEIALICGYEQTRQFLRLWNKYKLLTTTEYRQQSYS